MNSLIERVPLPIRRMMFGRNYAAYVKLQRSGRVVVGRATYGVPRVVTFAHDSTRLLIGAFTSIALDVTFVLGGNHPMDRVTTYPLRIMRRLPGAGTDGYPWTKGNVHVGSDVWLGYGAVVLSGVTIGDGAIVGACSVVTSDVPAYAVVGGVPARILRYRCEERARDALLELAWWDWPDDEIERVVELLCGSDVQALISYALKRRSAPGGTV